MLLSEVGLATVRRRNQLVYLRGYSVVDAFKNPVLLPTFCPLFGSLRHGSGLSAGSASLPAQCLHGTDDPIDPGPHPGLWEALPPDWMPKSGSPRCLNPIGFTHYPPGNAFWGVVLPVIYRVIPLPVKVKVIISEFPKVIEVIPPLVRVMLFWP